MPRTKMNPKIGGEDKEKVREKARSKAKETEATTARPDFLTRFQVQGEAPLTSSPMSVRLPPELDAVVRSLPNRTAWLRDAIIEKLQREALETDNPTEVPTT